MAKSTETKKEKVYAWLRNNPGTYKVKGISFQIFLDTKMQASKEYILSILNEAHENTPDKCYPMGNGKNTCWVIKR